MKPAAGATEEQFRAKVEPFRVALLDLMEQTQGLRQAASYYPAADSPAMAELAAEHRYAGGWGQEPVLAAHCASWVCLTAAEDLIVSMCRLFEHGSPPVYAHLVLARAALESCGRAAWLAEPGIDVRRRIARGVNERLYSLAEQAKLPGIPDGLARRQSILDEAHLQGFDKLSAKGQSVVSLIERRQSSTALVKWLLGQPDDDLGELAYRFWSSIAHATQYGLAQSFDSGMAQTSELDSRPTVPVVITTDQVRIAMTTVGLAYVEVGRFHQQLFGWQSDGWERTVVNYRSLLRSVQHPHT